MRPADRRDASNNRQSPAGFVGRDLERKPRRLLWAMPLALTMAAMGGLRPAFAQCNALCSAQAADQDLLLAPFTTLLSSPAGQALLAANFQTEDSIYLESTPTQKIASGTAFILGPQSSGFPISQANILLRAFPGNPSYGYDSIGLPSAPARPRSVAAAVLAIAGNSQVTVMKPFFGNAQIYGKAYGLLPGQTDTAGNPPPYQSSSAIQNNPFTAADSSAFAAANQQTNNGYGVNWQGQSGADTQIGDFPSAHTMLAGFDALTYAVLAPGYYQQLAQSMDTFSYDLNVFGGHYPLDVVGGRVFATYVLAETLAGNPLYPSTVPANLGSLGQAMRSYLGGGGSSPYAAQCAASVAACVAGGAIPSAATYTQQIQTYTHDLTYGLPSVGATNGPPVVPTDAHFLIATRFPYLDVAQLNRVLATTELPSGVPLDDSAGWARINLYAAASGYGAFANNVAVTMHAALGGLNAFDIWSNAVSGPGGLTLRGSGTLILAGNDGYTGGTSVQGGTLAVTGTLGGNLAISPGATFLGNGGYAVAGNATLANAGTFIEVNTPLVNVGTARNTGTIVSAVNNSGNFTNNAVVTGAFTNSGLLAGNGVVGSLALLPGSTIAPGNSAGNIRVAGNLTVAAGATYQTQVGVNGADLIAVGGSAALSGGRVVITTIGNTLTVGSAWRILTAAGGVSGGFNSLTEPTSGLAAGTRFDMVNGGNAISLVVTPGSYGDLAAAGAPESSGEHGVGSALDAIRPAPGSAPDPVQAALFGPLYTLPAGSIAAGLDELVPALYADGMITARNSWYLIAHAVSGQLAARRGLAADRAADGAPGPNGSTIWVSGLAGYDAIGPGRGSPGFSTGLGGAAAGIDIPVAGTWRGGVAVGTVDGQTWARAGGPATNSTAQFATYGQWQRGAFFAEAQLGLMYEQENARRSLPLFGATTQGGANGLAGGGGLRVGVQRHAGAWLIEPSLGFGGFVLHMGSVAETGGALAENIAGATLGSAESTLAVTSQRAFALTESMQMTVKGQLGWSHEFAGNTANVAASFAGLSGSGFASNSAPIGRDAAVIGLGADIKVASWPVTIFVGYGGAINGSSSAQSFDAGVRLVW